MIPMGYVAEREGFEPSIRFWRILTFQASAFDHSATAPHVPDRERQVAGALRFRKRNGRASPRRVAGVLGFADRAPDRRVQRPR
jgi:hypothetical protein